MFPSIQTIYFLPHVSVNIPSVAELSPVYCCLVCMNFFSGRTLQIWASWILTRESECNQIKSGPNKKQLGQIPPGGARCIMNSSHYKSIKLPPPSSLSPFLSARIPAWKHCRPQTWTHSLIRYSIQQRWFQFQCDFVRQSDLRVGIRQWPPAQGVILSHSWVGLDPYYWQGHQ